MNYTDLLRMLLEATVKGLVVWNYLDMNGKPIDYPPHHILGEVWGYEAKVGEIELRLFPRFIQGEDTQIFAVTLVGDKGDEYNRVS